MSYKLVKELWDRYHPLLEVAEQTVDKLGEEKTFLFVNLANDWIDLQGAMLDAYPKEELFSSLVYCDFTGVFQQIRWCQLMFLGGNYAQLYRNLRFVWEMAYRALYADHEYPEPSPAADVQPVAADDKIEWLETLKPPLHWNTAIAPGLRKVVGESESTINDLHATWNRLNECVHPSKEFRYRMIEPSNLLVTDGFDEAWANEALDISAEIFDLVWLSVLARFPKCCEHLEGSNSFKACPRTKMSVLAGRKGASPL
jgi:hypothetical protein